MRTEGNKATLRLHPDYHKGETFTIIAENNSDQNVYIQSATLNGQPLDRYELSYDEITDGGELRLEMGDTPLSES